MDSTDNLPTEEGNGAGLKRTPETVVENLELMDNMEKTEQEAEKGEGLRTGLDLRKTDEQDKIQKKSVMG